jgi:hypothetical protein
MSDKTFNRAIGYLKEKSYVPLEGRHYFFTKRGEVKVS